MAKFIKYILLVSLWATSCHRQHIYQKNLSSNSALLEVVVDWSATDMVLSEVSNLSLYAYTETEDAPFLKISGNIDTASIFLPVGNYILLLINDAVGDVAGVIFSNENSLEEFSAHTTPRNETDDIYYTPQKGEVLAETIGRIAAWHTSEVEVSEDMISCSYCGEEQESSASITLEASPSMITTQCVVAIEVENLNNAALIQATIQGLAWGLNISTNTPLTSEEEILYTLEFSSRNYFNDTDGTTQCEITTFGQSANEDQTYTLNIDVILGNGQRATFTRDVTDQVNASNEKTIYINLSGEENKIVLPASSGTGFGVENWGDNEHLELL